MLEHGELQAILEPPPFAPVVAAGVLCPACGIRRVHVRGTDDTRDGTRQLLVLALICGAGHAFEIVFIHQHGGVLAYVAFLPAAVVQGKASDSA
jgi:hypothetical protein